MSAAWQRLKAHPWWSATAALLLGSSWFWRFVGRVSDIDFLTEVGGRLGPNAMAGVAKWYPLLSSGLGIAILMALAAGKGARSIGEQRGRWRLRTPWYRDTAAPPPKLPSYEARRAELEEVQQIRALWNRHASKASATITELLNRLLSQLRQDGNYWSELLEPHPATRELEQATRHIAEAVADDSSLSLAEIHARVSAWFEAYHRVCRWIARIGVKDADLRSEKFVHQFEAWKQVHAEFRERVADLTERPAHKNQMRLFPQPELWAMDPQFAQFLKEAVKQPSDGVPAGNILSITKQQISDEQFVRGEFVVLVDMLVSEKTAFGNWAADLEWPDGYVMKGLIGTIKPHQCDVGRFELTVTFDFLKGKTANTRPISKATITKIGTVDHRGTPIEFIPQGRS